MITQSRLRQLFIYDQADGSLIRLTSFNRWKAGQVIGFENTSGYLEAGVDKVTYQLSRLVWIYHNGQIPMAIEIDHINGNKMDNRIENLRLATRAINNQNKRSARKDSSLGLLGVSWHKASASFIAQISKSGKKFHLGCFKTKEDAHQAYIKAKRSIHEGCTI